MESNATSPSPTADPAARALEMIEVEALRRLDAYGGPELVHQMIELCTEACSTRVAEIRGAQSRTDLPGVAHAAHSLKSSAGIIGARHLQHLADLLYRRAVGGDGATVATLAAELQDSFLSTLVGIEQLRRRWPR